MVEELTLISVDDHIIEPPNIWQDRLPARYREIGPRIVVQDVGPEDSRVPGKSKGDVFRREGGTEFWSYENKLIPTAGLNAVAGKKREDYTLNPVNYADMLPGCYDPVARVKDMDADGVIASLCFPSYPRFAGQLFLEAEDKELALLCVQAYNDWIIDEWCGAAPGRLIPLCIIPLWDPKLAAIEIERVAAKGARAIAFSENVSKLGLPSIHNREGHWDPVFRAASDAEMPLCMHIGSSSETIVTAPDAPLPIWIGLVPFNSPITCFDWLLSGVFERHPNLKIALSEGGIGWIPYVLDRADYTWEHQGEWTGLRAALPRPPSTYFADHIYGCFINDAHGSQIIEQIGVDNIMIETDYPHSDSTWPDSRALAAKQLSHLSPESVAKVARTNAERLFRFTASGIGER